MSVLQRTTGNPDVQSYRSQFLLFLSGRSSAIFDRSTRALLTRIRHWDVPFLNYQYFKCAIKLRFDIQT